MNSTVSVSEAPTQSIATLPPAKRAMIALGTSTVEEHLRDMLQESADIKEVKDKAGREQAHAAAMKLKNARIAIEKKGKAARDDANAFSKAVINEEKRLKGIISPEEERLFTLRDAYDAEQARIKAEEERKERERIGGIKANIESIRQIPLDLAGHSAAEIAEELAGLKEYVPGEEFAEFQDEAKAVQAGVIETLTAMHQRMLAVEEERARLAAERERLETERQEREAEEARRRAEREAEEARIKAEREALAEERRKLEEERAALVAQQAPAAPVAESVTEEPAQPNAETAPIVPVEAAPATPAEVAPAVVIPAKPTIQKEPDTAESLLRELVGSVEDALYNSEPEELNEKLGNIVVGIADRARMILN